ncbi:MAG: GNAT family N-acetyltransferase [Burkholderiaceae bacterium]|nr:GNAT family N-acetyltransferase [Burkholderiaceae bacterium]
MIASYDIAFARSSDAVGIAQLSRDAIEQGLPWSWTPPRVLRSMRDADTNAIVARERDALVGFAIMKYRDDEAHLFLMAVQFSRRRRGIGRALLDWLELTARNAGLASIRAEVRETNGPARSFYARHGYTEAQLLRGYYERHDDAVLLKKTLRGL